MTLTIRQMILGLSLKDRNHLKKAVMNKLGLTSAQYDDRAIERIRWDIEERAFIISLFEEVSPGKYEIKMTQDFFDLAGINYPVPS